METYEQFLRRKSEVAIPTGLDVIPELSSALFQFQKDIVTWALRRGRAALFAGTGLGKSLMELSWADAVHRETGRDVLLLTPLAVAQQMIREAGKFGITAKHCKTQSDVTSGIAVTNYQKLDHFDIAHFGGVVLDESSILKSLDGKTRTSLIDGFKMTPFRLAATATPAPNDYMELGNHAEFLGIMSYTDMLSTFFTHDGSSTQNWRLKGWAESKFWEWMASWSVMLRHPRDLGYDDSRYDLPPLKRHTHTVDIEYKPAGGFLFPMEAQTMAERLAARRDTISERVEAAAFLVNSNNRPWVCWCNLNDESSALAAAIPDAVEVRGSDSEDRKEQCLEDFAAGKIRVLVTKPSIAGFGMNWQHCADTVFVGLNDSFEQIYQAIRRFWRFGQTKSVNAHFVASEIEGAVVSNIQRKEAQAEHMAEQMVAHTKNLSAANIRGAIRDTASYNAIHQMIIPNWVRGDTA